MTNVESRPKNPDSGSLTVSVSEAAKLLGVSRDLVYELVAQSELPALRLGRRIVLPRRAIEELVESAGNHGGGSGQDVEERFVETGSPPPCSESRATLQLARRYTS